MLLLGAADPTLVGKRMHVWLHSLAPLLTAAALLYGFHRWWNGGAVGTAAGLVAKLQRLPAFPALRVAGGLIALALIVLALARLVAEFESAA